MSSNPVAYAQKRRSSRIDKAFMLAVQGVDASRAPYREEVTTGTISCHGCTYQMRHQVIPGDIVVLNSDQGARSYSDFPRRAKVKWVQKLDTPNSQAYNVGVELETAGNIWGIASPPEDWLPKQLGKPAEPASHGRELRLIARPEAPKVSSRSEGSAPPLPKKIDAGAALSPWFSDLMGGLSSQIQATVSEIAAVTLSTEKNRLLEEFRTQLQNEAAGTIELVIATSKEDLSQRALKLVNEGADAAVRNSHGKLAGAIERDVESAKQRLTTQEIELTQRVAAMSARTVEQLQATLEASRTEAAARFVSRLREQVAPVLEEARADLQKLVASQTVFKEESQAIYTRVTNQLESDANARLLQTNEELEKSSASLVNECNEKLRELSQTFQQIARDSAQTMIASATDDAKKNLEDRAAEISTYFTGQLEGHIRNYLEFIGESIAEFPKKTPAA
ncbi:MAG TPA: hypothetical protein VKV15_24885 [Bryobacteraceae bacterium]|nr:hypothetical protein [Bryobacteraceae bacterium]